MTQEEVHFIRCFAKRYLFKKYHNDYLDDCVQYLCIHKWQKDNYDLKYGVIDFCRYVGITETRARVKEKIMSKGVEMQDHYALEPEGLDILGTIEERLMAKNIPRSQINEVMGLLAAKDYSGASSCFRRIGLDLPVKYKYQRWDNSDRMYRFGEKIIKFLRSMED